MQGCAKGCSSSPKATEAWEERLQLIHRCLVMATVEEQAAFGVHHGECAAACVPRELRRQCELSSPGSVRGSAFAVGGVMEPLTAEVELPDDQDGEETEASGLTWEGSLYLRELRLQGRCFGFGDAATSEAARKHLASRKGKPGRSLTRKVAEFRAQTVYEPAVPPPCPAPSCAVRLQSGCSSATSVLSCSWAQAPVACGPGRP